MQRIHLAWVIVSLPDHPRNMTYSVSTFCLRFLSDQLDDGHLQQLVHTSDLIEIRQQISHGGGLRYIAKGNKGITFTRRVGLLN
jgi:hypothetical protein